MSRPTLNFSEYSHSLSESEVDAQTPTTNSRHRRIESWREDNLPLSDEDEYMDVDAIPSSSNPVASYERRRKRSEFQEDDGQETNHSPTETEGGRSDSSARVDEHDDGLYAYVAWFLGWLSNEDFLSGFPQQKGATKEISKFIQRYYPGSDLDTIPEGQPSLLDGIPVSEPKARSTNRIRSNGLSTSNSKRRRVEPRYITSGKVHHSRRVRIMDTIVKQALDPERPSPERPRLQNDRIVGDSISTYQVQSNPAWSLYEKVNRRSVADPVKEWLKELKIPCSGTFQQISGQVVDELDESGIDSSTDSSDGSTDSSLPSSLASPPPTSKAPTQSLITASKSAPTNISTRSKGQATTIGGETPPPSRGYYSMEFASLKIIKQNDCPPYGARL
ncbi:hypothetical protein CPB86DRAFT_473784 [Serendipita vermifera]|nr:hypothetical protein CPB86DRAFT_473784 [Serendipita vermifera]